MPKIEDTDISENILNNKQIVIKKRYSYGIDRLRDNSFLYYYIERIVLYILNVKKPYDRVKNTYKSVEYAMTDLS